MDLLDRAVQRLDRSGGHLSFRHPGFGRSGNAIRYESPPSLERTVPLAISYGALQDCFG